MIEGHIHNGILMAFEHPVHLPGRDIPYIDVPFVGSPGRKVSRHAGEESAVAAPGDAADG